MSSGLDQMAQARLSEVTQLAEWLQELQPAGRGYAGNEFNVLLAFTQSPELSGLLCFDEFAGVVILTRSPPWRTCGSGAPWLDSDDTEAMVWLQERGIAVARPGVVAATVMVVARKSQVHPVRDYLNGLVWDGTSRLKSMLSSTFGAVGPVEYLAAVGLRFMVSAVARAMRPGCQVDHTLVLESAQGGGKTTAVRLLARFPEWYAGSLPDVGSKDAQVQLAGRWIIEISELKALRNSQVEAVKSYLSQTADTFRPPYGRRTEQRPRHSVFIATTNQAEYLRDRTGNRRFWPVRCRRIDTDTLARDVDQLWAEAVHEYRTGTQWHLTPAESIFAREEQAERVHETELEVETRIYLAGMVSQGKWEVSVRDVLKHAHRLDPHMAGYADAARRLGPLVAEAMERVGWVKAGRAGGGREKRTMYRWSGQGGQG